MVLFIFLEGMELIGQMAHLGVVSLGFGGLDLRMILLDVLVDAFHEVLACAGLCRLPYDKHIDRLRHKVPPIWFPLQHDC